MLFTNNLTWICQIKYFEEMFPPFLNVLDTDLGVVDIALVDADKANICLH